MTRRWSVTGLLLAMSTLIHADQVEIVHAEAHALGQQKYRITVTLKHADSGWQHYANAWHVYSEQGQRLGTRTLLHPHVDEQPFSRSLSLSLPVGTQLVEIRAADSVHGISAHTFSLPVPP